MLQVFAEVLQLSRFQSVRIERVGVHGIVLVLIALLLQSEQVTEHL